MKKYLLILLLSNLLVAFFFAKSGSLLKNTLENNQKWLASKLNLEMGVMGAWNFFHQTQPLNQNHLDLGAWHGFQEIITRDQYEFDSMSFKIKLQPKSYLVLYYQINESTKSALRISDDLQNLACLSIDERGQYLSNTPIRINSIANPEAWQTIKLDLNNQRAKFHISGQEVSCEHKDFTSPSKIGFKNGLNNVLLDDIELTKDHRVLFKENFTNTESFYLFFILYFIVTTICQGLLILASRKFFKKTKIVFPLLLINLVSLLIIAISYNYFLFYFVGNYPNLDSIISQLRKEEDAWVDNEVELISKKIMSEFNSNDSEKVMFIGSSQTWGAGASAYDKTFPIQFETLYNRQRLFGANETSTHSAQVLGVDSSQNITVINAGISGTTSNDLLKEYEQNWINLHPRITIINLSSNDFDYGIEEEVFQKNLETFIELNQSQGIKTVLMIEARSKEIENSNEFQKVVKKVAEQNQVILIDSNQYLNSKNESGILWWDFIHPTDYGHYLIAEFLLKELSKLPLTEQQNLDQTSPQTASQASPIN